MFAVAPAYRRQAVQTAGLGERRQSLGKEKRTFHPRRRGVFCLDEGAAGVFPARRVCPRRRMAPSGGEAPDELRFEN